MVINIWKRYRFKEPIFWRYLTQPSRNLPAQRMLTIKTPERRHWRVSGAFFVNFEQIFHLALVFPLLTLNMYLPAGNNFQSGK